MLVNNCSNDGCIIINTILNVGWLIWAFEVAEGIFIWFTAHSHHDHPGFIRSNHIDVDDTGVLYGCFLHLHKMAITLKRILPLPL